MSDQALAAGAASIPGPIADGDNDGWFWHRFLFIQAVTATIADGVNASCASVEYEIDSKAMRKWDVGAQSIVGVIEVTELGTASMEHNANTRMLFKT